MRTLAEQAPPVELPPGQPQPERSPHAQHMAIRDAAQVARAAKRLKPAVLKELTAKHKLLAEYMVTGCPNARLVEPLGKDAGEPLTLLESAWVLGIRARQARDLASQALWHKYHASLLQAFREGHKAEALRTVVQVMRADGENKAADRKVKLTAASMLLGDAIAQQGQTQVNVSVGVGVAVTPGYVIDLSGDAGSSGPDSALREGQSNQPSSPVIDVTPVRVDAESVD